MASTSSFPGARDHRKRECRCCGTNTNKPELSDISQHTPISVIEPVVQTGPDCCGTYLIGQCYDNSNNKHGCTLPPQIVDGSPPLGKLGYYCCTTVDNTTGLCIDKSTVCQDMSGLTIECVGDRPLCGCQAYHQRDISGLFKNCPTVYINTDVSLAVNIAIPYNKNIAIGPSGNLTISTSVSLDISGGLGILPNGCLTNNGNMYFSGNSNYPDSNSYFVSEGNVINNNMIYLGKPSNPAIGSGYSQLSNTSIFTNNGDISCSNFDEQGVQAGLGSCIQIGGTMGQVALPGGVFTNDTTGLITGHNSVFTILDGSFNTNGTVTVDDISGVGNSGIYIEMGGEFNIGPIGSLVINVKAVQNQTQYAIINYGAFNIAPRSGATAAPAMSISTPAVSANIATGKQIYGKICNYKNFRIGSRIDINSVMFTNTGTVDMSGDGRLDVSTSLSIDNSEGTFNCSGGNCTNQICRVNQKQIQFTCLNVPGMSCSVIPKDLSLCNAD